ncbi:uncharacterized protein M421DRAFT_91902 [Didymella exigua CBS 183.55]|uniref:Uncharacterized protein n=1 Tax=Didymella exigua CBS 183.55 TaxID=1150837 RepID=A0A6A5RNV5_9PLEO|nr:uncharacterized protein M421DRAFT_91902 [Didymella exigua CBS 183.55]KAF1929452.1 hypothetical protein M421DRAFT_91902 [Didymella exigua CBS 183.55]
MVTYSYIPPEYKTNNKKSSSASSNPLLSRQTTAFEYKEPYIPYRDTSPAEAFEEAHLYRADEMTPRFVLTSRLSCPWYYLMFAISLSPHLSGTHVGFVSGRYYTAFHHTLLIGARDVYTQFSRTCTGRWPYLSHLLYLEDYNKPNYFDRLRHNIMSSSTTTSPAQDASFRRPMANSMPRRVSFGAVPTLERPQPLLTSSKTVSRASSEISELRFEKTNSISALDKKKEAQKAKLYKQKLKGVAEVVGWLWNKVKDGDLKND